MIPNEFSTCAHAAADGRSEDQGSANYLVSHKKAAQDRAWVMKPPLKRVCGENHVLCRAIEEYRADRAIEWWCRGGVRNF